MGKFPFEEIKREILIKKEADITTAKRPIAELLDYGIINIDKPKGPTSHQVADFVQKILKIPKSGHSGTLDPGVTGSLPIAINKATRIVQALLIAGKEYVCVMHIHKEIEEKKIKKVLKDFTGKITQLPPVKSAVVRQERERSIYYIDLLEIEGQDVLFKVGCQAGTYIRKLCLHPETEIISDSSLISAKKFFVNPSLIYTMNNKKIKQKLPSKTQKFNFNGNLIKITMTSGINFSVTPDHKMLISSNDGYIMKQASKLKESDYIVKSLKYTLPEINPTISDLLDDNYLIYQENIKEIVKEEFIKKYGSIRSMYRKLKLDRKAFLNNSKIAIPISHIKKAGIYENIKNIIYEFKTEKGTKIKLLRFNSDLLYLIGLIASDGNNTKEKKTIRHTRIKFHNKNKKLIELFLNKYTKIFPNLNISKTKLKDEIIQLDTSNSFLATICANLGVKSPQKYSDLFPILFFDKKLVASFLRGYFDGDGSAYYKRKLKVKGIYTKISFHTVNNIDAKRIHQMLLKLGISNKIFKKKDSYVIDINDIAAKKRFISLIGSNHPLKRERLKLIKNINSSEINDHLYIGLNYKKLINKNKSKLNKMGGNLNRVLKSKIPFTRGFYKKASKLVKLPLLDQFCIEKIKSIELTPYKGHVYDMTVPKTHNFLIETGFVSSNCHDIGKELKVGAHMAELRRTRVGPFEESTLVTLNDLTDAIHYYETEGNEKFLRSLIQPIENAIKHLPKFWVYDTAVKSLSHGADLKIPGIIQLHSNIKQGDTVAVISPENKLIALGETKLTSKEVMDKEKGIAVKVHKVFI
jgi:predicted RNA-binding protein (TIGR00451 family)